MKRTSKLTEKRPDPIRIAAGLPIGLEGGFFVNECGMVGQGSAAVCVSCGHVELEPGWTGAKARKCPKCGKEMKPDIVDSNIAPGKRGYHNSGEDLENAQPGLWCQWAPNDDATAIEWDGGEKFYNYTEWLEYIVKNFIEPWGYVLSGEVSFQGENNSDIGVITVTDNIVTVNRGITCPNCGISITDW